MTAQKTLGVGMLRKMKLTYGILHLSSFGVVWVFKKVPKMSLHWRAATCPEVIFLNRLQVRVSLSKKKTVYGPCILVSFKKVD